MNAPSFDFMTSRQFTSWLSEQSLSLSFTTYQAGKLFFVGIQADGRLSVFERTFNRCMGLWSDGQTMWMSSLYELWKFVNVLDAGMQHDGYDRLYVPQACYVTGDLDIHDLSVDGDGRLVFVNTLFGCLATTDDEYNFEPLWKPPFLSKLAAEDRCHLNGLAMREGKPRYVTAVGKTDVADGWRDCRQDGGIVLDVDSNQVIVDGLSMPHSPRWYRDRLWVLDSGNGFFGYVDEATGKFERVTFCPGYLRGLTFHGELCDCGAIRSAKEQDLRRTGPGSESGRSKRSVAMWLVCH